MEVARVRLERELKRARSGSERNIWNERLGERIGERIGACVRERRQELREVLERRNSPWLYEALASMQILIETIDHYDDHAVSQSMKYSLFRWVNVRRKKRVRESHGDE